MILAGDLDVDITRPNNDSSNYLSELSDVFNQTNLIKDAT